MYVIFLRWGHTPLDEAHAFGHSDVAEFLENWESTRYEDIDIKDSEKEGGPSIIVSLFQHLRYGDSRVLLQWPEEAL